MVYVVRIRHPQADNFAYLWHGKKMLCLENAQTFVRWKNAVKAANKYAALYTSMTVEAVPLDRATKEAK